MSIGSKPIRCAISSDDGFVPSRKRSRSRSPVSSCATSPRRPRASGTAAAARGGSTRAGSRRSRSRRPCPRGSCPGGSGCPWRPSASPRSPRCAAVVREARPEPELVLQLGDVPSIEERLEERSAPRSRVPRRRRGRSSERAIPVARDRLEDVRVDLGQRVVARDAPEGVRERLGRRRRRSMSCLVEERLVVVQPSLARVIR